MMIRKLFTLGMLAMLCACSNATELRTGTGGESFVVQNRTYDEVWDACIRAVQYAEDDRALELSRRLAITLQDKAAGHIEAETGVGMFSWGEMVGITVVPPHDAPEHNIRVHNLAKLKTNITSRDWERPLIIAIKKELEK